MNKTKILILTSLLTIILSGCAALSSGDTPTSTDPSDNGGIPFQSPYPSAEVILENDEWSSSWVENANQTGKPRILFVGDSIANGYFKEVKEVLGEDYYYAYYTTSKFIANPDWGIELSTLLNRHDFDLISINNGLHGFDHSIAEYEIGLEAMVQILADHDPEAVVFWVTSTPIRNEKNLEMLGALNQTVIARNQAAEKVAAKNGFLVLDLYGEMLGRPDLFRQDGVHYNENGQYFQAEILADFIRSIDLE